MNLPFSTYVRTKFFCTTGNINRVTTNKFVVELYAVWMSPYSFHELRQLLIDMLWVERFYMNERLKNYSSINNLKFKNNIKLTIINLEIQETSSWRYQFFKLSFMISMHYQNTHGMRIRNVLLDINWGFTFYSDNSFYNNTLNISVMKNSENVRQRCNIWKMCVRDVTSKKCASEM